MTPDHAQPIDLGTMAATLAAVARHPGAPPVRVPAPIRRAVRTGEAAR